MIYASAENLSWLNDEPTPARFKTEKAWNRYRVRCEKAGRCSKDFFPDVGIQPVTDGGLFAAGLFVAEKLGLPIRAHPRTFLETLAVANWCKFSIQSGTNRDYISDVKKLTYSLPYVIDELVVLQPAIVLIPKPVWRHPILRAAMIGASPYTRFMPVPQFNATVVNCHLQKYDRDSRKLKKVLENTILAKWMAHLHGFREENAWRYIAMLHNFHTSLLKGPSIPVG